MARGLEKMIGRGCGFSLVLTIGVLGCSQGATKSIVSGAVSMDGQPLVKGEIRFVAADGNAPTAGASIFEGKYSAEIPPGEKKVQISAPKVTGKRKMYEAPDSPSVDVVEELVPARYNVRTELLMTVSGGAQQKDFELQSK